MTARVAVAAMSIVLSTSVLMPAPVPAQQKKSRDLITREELLNSSAKSKDLYTAIRSLRPHFLAGASSRGTRSMGISSPAGSGNPGAGADAVKQTPVVYIDGTRFGGDATVLRDIATVDIEEVQYMNPTTAMNEFGVGHDGGAILVKRYKGQRTP